MLKKDFIPIFMKMMSKELDAKLPYSAKDEGEFIQQSFRIIDDDLRHICDGIERAK